MDPTHTLFAVLTLIAAPAVLTNASSVLGLNTANRFGRVIDRSRQLSIEVGKLPHGSVASTCYAHRSASTSRSGSSSPPRSSR